MNKITRLFILALGLAASLEAAPSFTPESGTRLSSATPQAIIGAYPDLRMYFLRDNTIKTSTSADGLTWFEETGYRVSTDTIPSLAISTITGASLLELDGGGYRMLYSVHDSSGDFKVVSATSTEGLTWANETTVIDLTTNTFVGSPKLVEMSDGDWRVYLVVDTSDGDTPSSRQIFTAVSEDEGVTWSTPTVAAAINAQEIGVSTLTNSRVRIAHTFLDTGDTQADQIRSVMANSGSNVSFSAESDVRFSTSAGILSFPLLFRSTDSYKWRMYYAFRSSATGTPTIFSALTLDPDVVSISPSEALRTTAATSITVSGEIFSSTPTITLTKSGETDVTATSVVGVDDRTLTADVATLNMALGLWSVVVTNQDGRSDTRANVFTITFGDGSVNIVDNVLRPRNNVPSEIQITINDAGRVHVQLFTLNGKFLRTLADQDYPIGTATVFWDGRNEDGKVVGSGTYIIKCTGPKLNQRQKIVVIR